ncbi:MAG: methyltransferase domain-containing protein [Dehalococcoidia bacterium]|nr:methyltransferase domain-containing protein [Dehalococcoidia bacterium]
MQEAAAPATTPASHEPEAARLGNPSYVWRSGQDRRVNLIERYVRLEGRRVLDLGCGLGEYVRAFSRRGATALGSDIAADRLREARQRATAQPSPPGTVAGFMAAAGEALPLRDASLDVVVLNEVIEHVADDRATLREVGRVLAPGGLCILYAPNRLYPFETHGIYLRGRYIFGNIPLVNWLPDVLRNRLVPHARAYRHGDWPRLIEGAPLEVLHHTYVYPGFDNIDARSRVLGRLLRAVCYWAEGNIFQRLGLSHLVVLRRTVGDARPARAKEAAR